MWVLQPRCDDGVLLARRQHTFDERRVADARDRARQHRAQSLDEPSWRRIRRTLLVWRVHDDLRDLGWCGWPEDINSRRRTWLDHGRRRVLSGVTYGADLIPEVIREIVCYSLAEPSTIKPITKVNPPEGALLFF